MEKIGRCPHLDALEVNIQRTAKFIQTLTNQDDADARGLISSEGEEEDTQITTLHDFYVTYKLYYRNNIL